MNVKVSKSRRNPTLWGLLSNAAVRVLVDRATREIVSLEGVAPDTDIYVAEGEALGAPAFVSVAGVPLFPSTYELGSEGTVLYHAPKAPKSTIRVTTDLGGLDERAKIQNYTVTVKKLKEHDRKRPRTPTQRAVMGESAAAHLARLSSTGRIRVDADAAASWHWCHLIAFSMLPTHRAQSKRNIVCGSAHFNGQMANIESAVKAFVYAFGRPLSLEVTASYLEGSHFALRVRYRIYDKKSGDSHTEYFDPDTTTLGASSDFDIMYNRLVERFESKAS